MISFTPQSSIVSFKIITNVIVVICYQHHLTLIDKWLATQHIYHEGSANRTHMQYVMVCAKLPLKKPREDAHHQTHKAPYHSHYFCVTEARHCLCHAGLVTCKCACRA